MELEISQGTEESQIYCDTTLCVVYPMIYIIFGIPLCVTNKRYCLGTNLKHILMNRKIFNEIYKLCK